jgi:O-antigen/teichoic acid export membrane protein
MINNLKKNKKNINNFLLLAGKNIVLVVLSLFQLYILTQYLDIESYGKFQFVITILSSIAFFTLPGSNLAYNKMGAKNDERYYFSLLKYKIIFSYIGSFVLISISLFYYDEKSLFYSLIVGSIAFPLYFNLDSYLSLLNGQEKFYEKVKYELLKQISIVGSLAIAVTFYNEDYFILLTILFSVSISFNLIAHFWLFKNSVEKKVTTRKVENYKKYSKDMSWINVIGTIEAQIDRVLVGVLFGFTSLAIYHVAKVIQDQLKNIWVVFVNMIMPRTYKKSKIKSIHFLLKIITPVFVVFFVIVLMVIFILPTIFTFVFDEKYFDAMNYLNVMLFGVLIGIPNAVLIIYFNTYSKLKDLLIIKITTSVVYFLSLILFVYYWEIWGIIFANIARISYASLITIVYFIIERKKVLLENKYASS